MTDQALDPLDTVRTLLLRIGDQAVRQQVGKTLALWELGYVREALTQFRITAEQALRRILEHGVEPGRGQELAAKLDLGQCARVIERLYNDLEVIPARIALHLHTLLGWGNYASHHQKQGHRARASDLAVLISIAVDLDDWITTELEQGSSIFDPEHLARVVHQAESISLGSSDLDPAVVRAFITLCGAGVQASPYRLLAPHLSMELIWRRADPTTPGADGSPYRGLQAFQTEDAHRFHGRADICRQLERNVDTRRLTVLSGASGTGKTSLLQAGLIPLLTDLGCGVLRLSEYGEHGLRIVDRMVEVWPSRPLVLIFDQLERALLPGASEAALRRLMAHVVTSGRQQEGLRVVVSIREDFLGQLLREAQSAGGGAVLSEGKSLIAVEPLSDEEACEAITAPLEGTGVSFDDDLLRTTLLPELTRATAATPSALQIVCGRLHAEARGGGAVIDAALYEDLGGVDRILGSYFDEALRAPQYADEQELARSLLRAMTGPQARRWVDLGTLWQTSTAASAAPADEVRLRSLLGQLMDDRLVACRGRGEGAAAEYSLMHDQLAHIVRGWSDAAEREQHEAQEQLDRAVDRWSDLQRREVLRGRALTLVEAHWARLHRPRAAEAEAVLAGSRQNHRRRRLALGLLAVVVLASLAFGIFQLRRAVRERDRAVQMADQGVMLRARLALDRDPTLAVAWLRNLSRTVSGTGVLTLMEEARRRGVASQLQGHEQMVTSVAFSPDGKTLASAGRDGIVRLWDVKRRRAPGEPLRGHASFVNDVAFSPDGRILASAGRDGVICLWDVGSRRRLGQLTGHRGAVFGLSFAPGGETLASAGADGRILRWEVSSRRRLGAPLVGHGKAVMALSHGPRGRTLASAGLDATVRLWDLPAGTSRVLHDHAEGVYSVAISPDGRYLASAGLDATARLWSLGSAGPARARALSGHSDMVFSVTFSSDSKTLATAGADKMVRLWDTATGARRGQPLRGHLGLVHDVAFSPNGRTLASGSRDHTVRLWDLASRRQEGLRLYGHTKEVWAVAFSPDGKSLVTGSRDHTVRQWDLASRRHSSVVLDHQEEVYSVALAPGGRWLASAGWRGRLRLWRLPATAPGSGAPALTTTVETGARAIYEVAISPRGRTLAVARSDGRIQLWEVLPGGHLEQRGAPLAAHDDAVTALTFSPDGLTLVSGSRDRTVQIWKVPAARGSGLSSLATLRGHGATVYSVAFSPDGKTLASGGGDAKIQLWDVGPRQARGTALTGHRHWVLSVAFSADGKTLASASSDGTVRLWDTVRGRALGPPLLGHTDWVYSVAFSPDGKTLASASADGTAFLWQLSRTRLSRLRRTIDTLTNVYVSQDGRVTIR